LIENKKILIITYYWPPDNSSGVQRWGYFAHFLAKYGLDIQVVTVNPKWASYKNQDTSFKPLVKGINTHTTETIELLKLYSFATTGHSSKGIPRGSINDQKNIFKRISNYIKSNFFIPDARVGWNTFAYRKAKKLITDPENTIVITTGPPHSTHLVGHRLKNIFHRLTWVCDFRDPWLELYSNANAPQNKRARKKNRSLEKMVLENADQVITVGPSLVKLLQSKLPSNKHDKVNFFYNGFDNYKMDKIPHKNPKDFIITFIGLIPDDYQVEGFIHALQKFTRIISGSRNVILRLAGNISPNFINQLENISTIKVNYLGVINHAESLKLMKSASLLFTILPTQKFDEILISGKLMEYIASKKPILCLANKNGDAASLIKKTKSGKTFTNDETDKIANFISACYRKEFLVTEQIDIIGYSRESIANSLYTFLKGL
jgi:glycosyltransferase involved in cell wall biosynthesis